MSCQIQNVEEERAITHNEGDGGETTQVVGRIPFFLLFVSRINCRRVWLPLFKKATAATCPMPTLWSTYHLSLSDAPAEKVDDLSTSPISSRQKEKLLMVHM